MRGLVKSGRVDAPRYKLIFTAPLVVVVGILLGAGCSRGPSQQELANYDSKPTKLSEPKGLTPDQQVQWIQNNPNLSDDVKQADIARIKGLPGAPSQPPPK